MEIRKNLSALAVDDARVAAMAAAYSKEEISALRGIFALYDPDGTGEISSADLESLLQKIGLKQEAARGSSSVDVTEPTTVDFAKFLELRASRTSPARSPTPRSWNSCASSSSTGAPF